MEEHQYINQEMIFLILHEVSSTHSHEWAKGAQSHIFIRLRPDQWSLAIHLIHLTSYQPTFFYSKKGENPKIRRHQDVKDIKKNVKTDLDTVSLGASGGCCVQLLEMHIVKEDDFHGK